MDYLFSDCHLAQSLENIKIRIYLRYAKIYAILVKQVMIKSILGSQL